MTETVTVTFGRWLRKRRRSLDLTQDELADRVGYAVTTIRRIEADDLRPSKELANLLAEALDLAADERLAFVQFARGERAAPPPQRQPQPVPARDATEDRSTPAHASRPLRYTLPIQRTPLIGRQTEVATLCALLPRAEVGLVTLTGVGGAGKTSLALEVATRLGDDFPDGVKFVNLAPVSDPDLVTPIIAQSLDIREEAGLSLLESLKNYVRDKRLLLILDNFEQVISAAPVVAELLGIAPRLRALVTSRQVLKLRGEREFTVLPLSVPDVKRLPPVDALLQYDAVRLFMARAAEIKPDFSLTQDNAPAIAEICQRLDGLPLAIELAVGRLRLLSPQAMLPLLDRRFKLLTAGAQDLPARQQTLRGVIEWSYDLLNESEKRLFRRLSVFVGGFTLDAVAAICYEDGKTPLDALDEVEALLVKSLLKPHNGLPTEPRFTMLETIREFARDTLDAQGNDEAATTRDRHAQFFLGLAEQGDHEIRGAEQMAWYACLELEHDNLRAALHWSRTSEQGRELGLKLATALGWFWLVRGYWTEGQGWLESVLTHAQPPGRTATRAGALRVLGHLASASGDDLGGRPHLEESVAIGREVNDRRTVALALRALADNALWRGEMSRAQALFDECVVWYRDVDDEWGWAWILQGLSDVELVLGYYEQARILLEDSAARFRKLGERVGMSFAASHLGVIELHQEDYAAARAHFEERVVIDRETGNRTTTSDWVRLVGETEVHLGNLPAARSRFLEALRLELELGREKSMPSCLEGFAVLAVAEDKGERAARLLAAADTIRSARGYIRRPIQRQGYERSLNLARQQVGQAAFDAAWQTGQAMTLEQAIAYALDNDTRHGPILGASA